MTRPTAALYGLHAAIIATVFVMGAAAWWRTSLPTAAPAGKSSSSPASLHSLGTGAAEATGGGE